jgi:FMN phosphatase YigB (HAD superfamily)
MAHQLVPQQTWFIDDHLPNVEAARVLGWQGLHLSEPQALADLLGAALP